MTNSFAAELADLSPDHSWPMGEASGDYLDEVGALDLALNLAASVWRQSPGLIRNSPWEFGAWGNAEVNGRFIISALGDVPAATGWDTGVLNCFMMLFDTQDGIFVPFSVGGGNGTAPDSSVRFEVNTDGSVRFVVGAVSSGNWAVSAASVISLGVPYMLTGIQRDDTNGMRILVNGVDVTDSQGGSAGADSFIGDLFSGGVASHISVNGEQDAGSQGARAIVQRPAIWRNTVLTDAQVLALYNSASLDAEARDYYEYVLENFVVPGSTKWWWPGWLDTSQRAVDGGTNGRGATGTDMTMSSMVSPSIVETDRITQYANYKDLFQGATNAALSVPELSGFSTGTINLLLTFQEVSTSGVKFIYGLGATGAGMMTIAFAGFTLGYRVSITLGENNINNVLGTNGYRQNYLPADGGIPLAGFTGDLFGMFTIVQDGANGLTFYRDGVEQTHQVPEINGTGWDEDSWWNDVPTASDGMGFGFPSSYSSNNFDENEVNDLLLLPGVALDAAEVLELWHAVIGIFPADVVPPVGGFADTLGNTGNDGDPNGPGPNHWWRMNAEAAPIIDIGLNEAVSPNGDSIAVGGDPDFLVQGPLITDPTNFAIYFDGQGDYLEIGVDGIAGELVTDIIGTIGFFFSRNGTSEAIIYSQADDTGAEYFKIGISAAGSPFLEIQNQAGNTVRYESSHVIDDLEFGFYLLTNDGSNYIWYISCEPDAAAVLTLDGTGVEGQWFDDITATRSAVGALATSTFDNEMTGRPSELFIYDEVLTVAQVCALWDAALADGIAGSANDIATLVFENVTFKNGGVADVRVSNSLDDFSQVLQIDRSQFLGGAEGDDKQGVLLTGPARVQVHDVSFDLEETPTTGRAAIVATVADPTAETTIFGTLLVSDSTFDRMGYLDSLGVARPAVFAESGFGMTVEKSRFFDSFGSAIGWRADARRINVLHNLIDTISNTTGAIYSQNGLNTGIGTAWQIIQNSLINAGGIRLEGANSSLAEFARGIQVLRNKVIGATAISMLLDGVQDLMAGGNLINGGTQGIRVGEAAGRIAVLRNQIEGHSAEGIYMSEVSLQAAVMLLLDRNTINGASVADGILVDNVARMAITNNKLLSVQNGLQIGTIGTSGKVAGNQMRGVTTPLTLTGTQTGLEFGFNQFDDLGDALAIVSNAVTATAHMHTITASSATDLNTINGPNIVGYTLLLQLDAGATGTVTVKDAVGNIQLSGDYDLDTAGESQIWFIFDGTNWLELSEALGT